MLAPAVAIAIYAEILLLKTQWYFISIGTHVCSLHAYVLH